MNIHGTPATLFRKGPPAVYIRDDGYFGVQINRQWAQRPTIAAIDKLLKSTKNPVKLVRYRINRGSPMSVEARIVEAIEWTTRGGLVTKENHRLSRLLGQANYALFDEKRQDAVNTFDKKIVALNKQHYAEVLKLEKELAKIIGEPRRVHVGNFASIQKELAVK